MGSIIPSIFGCNTFGTSKGQRDQYIYVNSQKLEHTLEEISTFSKRNNAIANAQYDELTFVGETIELDSSSYRILR